MYVCTGSSRCEAHLVIKLSLISEDDVIPPSVPAVAQASLVRCVLCRGSVRQTDSGLFLNSSAAGARTLAPRAPGPRRRSFRTSLLWIRPDLSMSCTWRGNTMTLIMSQSTQTVNQQLTANQRAEGVTSLSRTLKLKAVVILRVSEGSGSWTACDHSHYDRNETTAHSPFFYRNPCGLTHKSVILDTCLTIKYKIATFKVFSLHIILTCLVD